MAGDQPTGTVTFLFTDVEGSTRLWDERPDEMDASLAQHDEIVRSSIKAHGGYVFATGGDGFCVAFADATGAVAMAVEVQRGVNLPVRMGMHTGVAQVRGGDYFGVAVNRAARVMSVAYGGQVLVSQATADLLLDASGIELLSLGEHMLRDLSRPESLYQVEAEGLRADFGRTRSVGSYRTNLPAQRSSLVGRDEQVKVVLEAIGHHRLVTLTGVGGVGKTRLALQVAAETLGEFSDGVWFCELAAASDDQGVAEVIALAAGIRQHQSMDVVESVVYSLRHQHALVVMDNCEHLLDPAAEVAAAILDACPHVRLVATSREGLALDGERILAVPSLSVPSLDDDDVFATAAAQLFTERASVLLDDFSITAADEDAVADICRRLDGIPLALELAAARVVAMTPVEIAERLDDRFRLLSGRRGRGRDRHQTLRSAIDWSYDLLDQTTQQVMARLAVFGGSFDLDAAAAAVRLESYAVSDAVAGLVSKSLLTAEAIEGRTRYRYLETIRQYAEEQLDRSGEAAVTHRAAAQHFNEWAEVASSELLGPNEHKWSRPLLLEVPNLRRLVEWAVDIGELDVAAALLAPFHRNVNIYSEPLRSLAWLLWQTDPAGSFARAPEVFALAIEHAHGFGDLDAIRAIWGVIDRISEDQGIDPPAMALNVLAQAEASGGSLQEAFEIAQQAASISQRQDDKAVEIQSLCAKVVWGTTSGELPADVGLELSQHGLELADEVGSPSVRAVAEFCRASALVPTDPGGALIHYRRTHELAPPETRTYDAGAAFGSRVAALLGDSSLAAELIGPCVDRWVRNRDARLVDIAIAIGATIALDNNDIANARDLTHAARATSVNAIFPELMAYLDNKLDLADERPNPLAYDEAVALAVDNIHAKAGRSTPSQDC